MITSRRNVALLVLVCLHIGSSLHAQIERQHGAHVHGTSVLDVVLDGSTLSIHLDAPAINLLGFEHPPRTPEERSALAGVLHDLNNPSVWLEPAGSANCVLRSAKVEANGLQTVMTQTAESAGAAEHADFDADYVYECANAAQLDSLELRLGAHYPNTHVVQVNIVLPDMQTQVVLEGDKTRVNLVR